MKQEDREKLKKMISELRRDPTGRSAFIRRA